MTKRPCLPCCAPWRAIATTIPLIHLLLSPRPSRGESSGQLWYSESLYGSSHPRTLATRYDHALVMRLTRGAQAAAALLAALEEDCLQALGSSHPLTQTIVTARR